MWRRGLRCVISGEAVDGRRTVGGRRWAVFVASRENLPVGAVGACLERRRERPRTDRVNGGQKNRSAVGCGRCLRRRMMVDPPWRLRFGRQWTLRYSDLRSLTLRTGGGRCTEAEDRRQKVDASEALYLRVRGSINIFRWLPNRFHARDTRFNLAASHPLQKRAQRQRCVRLCSTVGRRVLLTTPSRRATTRREGGQTTRWVSRSLKRRPGPTTPAD